MRRPHKATRAGALRPASDVLIVEADPELQVELAHTLRSQGHRVVAASSASGALALTTHFPVDLVLVSQELPRTTGIDVTYALTEHRPELRVVVVTDEGSPGLYAAARRAGAYDCAPRTEVATSLQRWLQASTDERTSAAQAAYDYELENEVAMQSAE